MLYTPYFNNQHDVNCCHSTWSFLHSAWKIESRWEAGARIIFQFLDKSTTRRLCVYIILWTRLTKALKNEKRTLTYALSLQQPHPNLPRTLTPSRGVILKLALLEIFHRSGSAESASTAAATSARAEHWFT